MFSFYKKILKKCYPISHHEINQATLFGFQSNFFIKFLRKFCDVFCCAGVARAENFPRVPKCVFTNENTCTLTCFHFSKKMLKQCSPIPHHENNESTLCGLGSDFSIKT